METSGGVVFLVKLLHYSLLFLCLAKKSVTKLTTTMSSGMFSRGRPLRSFMIGILLIILLVFAQILLLLLWLIIAIVLLFKNKAQMREVSYYWLTPFEKKLFFHSLGEIAHYNNDLNDLRGREGYALEDESEYLKIKLAYAKLVHENLVVKPSNEWFDRNFIFVFFRAITLGIIAWAASISYFAYVNGVDEVFFRRLENIALFPVKILGYIFFDGQLSSPFIKLNDYIHNYVEIYLVSLVIGAFVFILSFAFIFFVSSKIGAMPPDVTEENINDYENNFEK